MHTPNTTKMLNITVTLESSFILSAWSLLPPQPGLETTCSQFLYQIFCSVTQSCPTLATQWTTACQTSLSITNSWSLLKPMSIQSVIPSSHLILCRPLLLLRSIFPASGSFQMSQFFASGGQSIGVSTLASVLPMSIQD